MGNWVSYPSVSQMCVRLKHGRANMKSIIQRPQSGRHAKNEVKPFCFTWGGWGWA